MPPFVYQPYDPSGAAASIGELLARQNAARARAAEVSGQAWAQAAQHVGQIPRQVMGEMQAQRDAAQERRARATQIESGELGLARQKASQRIGALITSHVTTTPDGHLVYDVDGFAKAAQADPDLASMAHEPLDAMQKANDSYQQWREGRLATKTAVLKDIYQKAAEAGGTPDDLTLLSVPYVKGGVLDESDLAPMMRRLLEVPDRPARLKLLGAAAGVKPVSMAPGASLVDPITKEATFTAPNPAEDRLAKQAEETARHNQEMERIAGLTAGRQEAQAAETARHNRTMERIAQQNADTTKNRYTSSGIASTMAPEYSTALERAMLSVPAARRPAAATLANRLWSEGKSDELKDVIRQTAIESENVDTKNQVLGRMATLASLRDTRDILNELKAKGVPTGWFEGSLENLARRLGKTTNPEYVTLANRLMGTLINYRRAATGVAFSARESADYARMFPNYKNDVPVNMALLDGLERELTTYDREYWTHKLGEAGAKLVGVGQMPPPATAESDGWTTVNGIRIREKR